MNKDAILASIIGFGIGLMITGAILVGPTLLPLLQKTNKPGDVQSASTNATPSPQTSPSATDTQGFRIDSPTDESSVDNSVLKISGQAAAGTFVVAGSPEDESVVEATTSNTFQTQVTLKEGKNDISVTNLSDSGNTIKHVIIYYSPKL